MTWTTLEQMEWFTARHGALTNITPIDRGYTPARRALLDFEDGRRLFLKWACTDLTAGWLRRELEVYRALDFAHMPRLLDAGEDPDQNPYILLEDLRHAHWPPAWREGDVRAVLTMLDRLAEVSFDAPWLPRAEHEHGSLKMGWGRVKEAPEEFLALGFRDARWLDERVDTLIDASARVDLSGESLCHLDVRSDNICILDGRAILIDWNWISMGAPGLDAAFWMPSLMMEGGGTPEELMPGAHEHAAMISGVFAWRAGKDLSGGVPAGVREVQKFQLRGALDWVDALFG